MTEPSDKALESQLRLAAASRPGSLEARHVYGCTCVPTQGRLRVWNPESVDPAWLSVVGFECPAHGRALERLVQSEKVALDEAMGKLLKLTPSESAQSPWEAWAPSCAPHTTFIGVDRSADTVRFSTRLKPRTKLERLRDAAWSAYYGFLEEWRGP